MIIGAYRDLFAAIATAAAALTGLLFVAISVAPRHSSTTEDGVLQDVRAAASLLAFTNALAVSLFGLVPGNNVGYPAVVLGVSRRGESHPPALVEPGVNLSAHRAPIVQPSGRTPQRQ